MTVCFNLFFAILAFSWFIRVHFCWVRQRKNQINQLTCLKRGKTWVAMGRWICIFFWLVEFLDQSKAAMKQKQSVENNFIAFSCFLSYLFTLSF